MSSPLLLSQFVRDLWGRYDAAAIAQLNGLAEDTCYQPKFYKAPSIDEELMAPLSYVPYGLKITPGAIIYGFYLPLNANTHQVQPFSVQITDQSLEHQFWSEAIPSNFISNSLTTAQHSTLKITGTFPKLLPAPYPVTGDGLFLVELYETGNITQRIELVIGAFEPVEQVVQL